MLLFVRFYTLPQVSNCRNCPCMVLLCRKNILVLLFATLFLCRHLVYYSMQLYSSCASFVLSALLSVTIFRFLALCCQLCAANFGFGLWRLLYTLAFDCSSYRSFVNELQLHAVLCSNCLLAIMGWLRVVVELTKFADMFSVAFWCSFFSFLLHICDWFYDHPLVSWLFKLSASDEKCFAATKHVCWMKQLWPSFQACEQFILFWTEIEIIALV